MTMHDKKIQVVYIPNRVDVLHNGDEVGGISGGYTKEFSFHARMDLESYASLQIAEEKIDKNAVGNYRQYKNIDDAKAVINEAAKKAGMSDLEYRVNKYHVIFCDSRIGWIFIGERDGKGDVSFVMRDDCDFVDEFAEAVWSNYETLAELQVVINKCAARVKVAIIPKVSAVYVRGKKVGEIFRHVSEADGTIINSMFGPADRGELDKIGRADEFEGIIFNEYTDYAELLADINARIEATDNNNKRTKK